MTTNKQTPDADRIARALRLLDLHEEMLAEVKEFRRLKAIEADRLAKRGDTGALIHGWIQISIAMLDDLIARAEAAQ